MKAHGVPWLIRHLAGDPAIEVPSPSFTLMQTYELPRFTVVHADLYRVSGASELAELGFDDLPAGTVILLEWPDRAAGFLPPDRLDIAFTLAPQLGLDYRDVRITGYGSFAPRAERIAAARRFLDESDCGDAARERRDAQERHRLGQKEVRTDNAGVSKLAYAAMLAKAVRKNVATRGSPGTGEAYCSFRVDAQGALSVESCKASSHAHEAILRGAIVATRAPPPPDGGFFASQRIHFQ